MSFLDKLKKVFSSKDDKAVYLSGFKKTNDSLSGKFKEMSFQYEGITDEFLEELMIVLLESDVGVETADLICEKLKERAANYPDLEFSWAMSFILEIMKEVYEEYPDGSLILNEDGPTVILLEGVNGSGKTTTAAKLAKMFRDEGRSVCLAAADTFRAGAVEQLSAWADRLGLPCVKGRENGDPSAVIVDGCRYAKEHGTDILICDTAGRLQNKQGLMQELGKMNRVCAKEIPGAPHNTWLVLDATTGQNGLNQARIFNEATTLSGIILTKMDGTAKGGIVLAIKHVLHLPVLYLGLGEQPDDLRPFDVDSYLFSISEGLDHVG